MEGLRGDLDGEIRIGPAPNFSRRKRRVTTSWADASQIGSWYRKNIKKNAIVDLAVHQSASCPIACHDHAKEANIPSSSGGPGLLYRTMMGCARLPVGGRDQSHDKPLVCGIPAQVSGHPEETLASSRRADSTCLCSSVSLSPTGCSSGVLSKPVKPDLYPDNSSSTSDEEVSAAAATKRNNRRNNASPASDNSDSDSQVEDNLLQQFHQLRRTHQTLPLSRRPL